MTVNTINTHASPAPARTSSVATASPAQNTGEVAQTDNVGKIQPVQPTPAQEQAAAAAQSAAQPSRAQIDQAVTEVKRALAPVARNLQFSIDEDTGKTVVKVIDQTTKEVIRQIPSEELLSITRSLDKFSGLFVKQKA